MNTKNLGLLLTSFLACAASGLRAETATASPPFQVDVSFPYALQWRSEGIVGDAGLNWMGNFIGAEISYYDGTPKSYAFYSPTGVYDGLLNYRIQMTTFNVAYRYAFPLPLGGMTSGSSSPLKAYIGGSAGGGSVDYTPGLNTDRGISPGAAANAHYSNSGRFDYTLVAGIQWDLSTTLGIKAGYRFIEATKARFYNTGSPLDTGAFEVGGYFRF